MADESQPRRLAPIALGSTFRLGSATYSVLRIDRRAGVASCVSHQCHDGVRVAVVARLPADFIRVMQRNLNAAYALQKPR